jgi:phosphatidylglycerophosphate synthase
MVYKFDEFYKTWIIAFSVANLLAVTIDMFVPTSNWWLVLALFFFGFYISKISKYKPNIPFGIGYANTITTFRLLLVIVGLVFHSYFDTIFLGLIFLVNILLDGVDGYVARKMRQSSKVGEVLDMETDAFFVFAISWFHVNNHQLSAWILLPGSLRYIYALLVIKPGKEIIPKRVRASIAVFFFFALLIPFFTEDSAFIWLTYLASGLIVISFAISLLGRKIKM